MRQVVFGLFALVALPVVVVIALGVLTGVLTGGTTAAVDAGMVNGWSLEQLRELPEDDLVYPDGTTVERLTRVGSTLALGGDVAPLTGRRVLVSVDYDDVVDWHAVVLEGLGWEPIPTPLALGVEQDELIVETWRRDNLAFRLSLRTDSRAVIEAGGDVGDNIYQVIVLPFYRVDG